MTEKSHEAKGWASTKIYRDDGLEVTITERSDAGSQDALSGLVQAIIDRIDNEIWFATRRAATNAPSSVPQDTPQGPPAPEGPPTGQPSAGKDWGLVDYSPKASELSPNDYFEVEVDEFKYDGAKIYFYKSESKYPDHKHNLDNEKGQEIFKEVFNGWMPDKPTDGRVPLRVPTVLEIKCSGPDNLTSQDNPWRNLAGWHKAE